jgi:hypothetical protein
MKLPAHGSKSNLATRVSVVHPGDFCGPGGWQASRSSLPYRLENWNRLRAPGCPDFLRSFIRGSRVSKPSSFNTGLIAPSCSNNARAIANRTAPACPVTPPPVALIFTSNELLVFVTSNGFKTVNWSEGVGKYSSSGRPLTSIFPEPRDIRTWATAFLRRPVAANTSDIFFKIR